MKPRILLLEDDIAIAGTVAFALEREGFAVIHVLLLRDADAQVRRHTPAVAILDVGLPDGNGLDLCRSWRADPTLATLPTLMLTARGEEIDSRTEIVSWSSLGERAHPPRCRHQRRSNGDRPSA